MKMSNPIPLGEWAPDAIDLNNPGGVVEAKNVVPEVDGYGPFKSLQEVSESLGDDCIGAKTFLSSTGAIFTFAGTLTGLYRYNSDGTWTDVTWSTAAYQGVAGDFWDFIAYGDRIVATNYRDEVQTFLMGTDSQFSQLSATAPRCRRLGIINEFLFLVDTVDSIDGVRGIRVWWSPIGNPQGVYTPSQATQCDYQDLAQDSSPVVAVIGGQNVGFIMKGVSLHRAQYIGPPNIFSIKLLEQERGSNLPLSVIGDGRNFYYKADEGFQYFNGSVSVPIGKGKVDGYFKDNFDSAYGNRVQAATSPSQDIVAWAFPGPGNNGGKPNQILIYSRPYDRWTLIEQEIECLVRSFGDEYTLEELDTLYSSLEDIPFSLDSLVWRLNTSVLGAFSTNSKLGVFDGSANMTGIITTGESQLNKNGKAYVQAVEPIGVHEDDVTVAVGSRDLQKNAINWTGEVSVYEETGKADFDVEARFHRARFTITGDNWERITGFKIGYMETGHV